MKIKTVNYTIKDSKIPQGLSGYRIALFSDTHNRLYGKNFQKLLEPIVKAAPDIVVFAGDAVKKKKHGKRQTGGHENAAGLFEALAKLFTVYFITGNHDKRFEKQSEGTLYYSNFIQALKNAGVKLLLNESCAEANGLLTVSGLDFPLESYERGAASPSVSEINDLLGMPGGRCYNLLLAHTPKFFDKYAAWGADLTLCGHIHGGMLRLKNHGLLSPHKQFFPRYCYGLYQAGRKKMIVSSGAGDHNIRFTLCNPFEICIITLETGDAEDGT